MDIAIVIPARMGSTRFPGKPLCDLLGKPMVRWVVEAAQSSGVTDRVIVATPDREIVESCESFGAEAILTGHHHVTGTDRIAEVAQVVHANFYINVQGDEPLIQPETIVACAEPLTRNPVIDMSSVYCDCAPEEEQNPAAVKVVTDHENFALYFSRYPIPYPRNPRSSPAKKHIGIYGCRRGVLARFSKWAPTELESTESLEQLRFMEHGIRIKMNKGPGTELAVDTPEQAEEVRQILKARAQN